MNAIVVTDLWEGYRPRSSQRRSLQASLRQFGKGKPELRWGLKGVSFDVPQGEMVGIVGHNGSGKSTLLRCLAGIYRPSKGTVLLRGRATSLIDLEAGFQRDLSATDNILLAGAVYGVPKKEMKERFDEVIAFSGLEDDADTLLRAFSTGMAIRLGFSVAVMLDPDILLIDEVLAVGDEGFKVKCLEKIRTMRDAGATIVFVSHDLALIRKLCDRVIVLDHGTKIHDGNVQEGLESYCERLGVDLEEAMTRPSLDHPQLEKVERRWMRRNILGP